MGNNNHHVRSWRTLVQQGKVHRIQLFAHTGVPVNLVSEMIDQNVHWLCTEHNQTI